MSSKKTKITENGGNIDVPATIHLAIRHLLDGDNPLSSSTLSGLSDLDSSALAYFKDHWSHINVRRRRLSVSRFIELEDNDSKLDFEAVFRVLLDDCDAKVRICAVTGLWESRKPSLMGRLIYLLDDDSSQEVRAAAAQSLGKYAMMAECGVLRPDDTIRLRQTLFKALEDKNTPFQVKLRALEAAAPFNHPFVTQNIRGAYASGNNQLKTSSLYAMGRSADTKWLPILLHELDSTDAEMRYEAATACGELEDETAVPDLIAHTEDSDTEVQLAAIKALGDIGGKQAIKHLRELLSHPNKTIRELAKQMLDEAEAREYPLAINNELGHEE